MTIEGRGGLRAPEVVDPDADAAFRDLVKRLGMDPDDRFVGGVVAYAWGHVRHVLDGLFFSVEGARALELGCHLGATACVLAALGADVVGVDPDADLIAAARANAARHGLAHSVTFVHVPDSSRLPFAPRAFDLVTAVSVLEYVAPEDLRPLLCDADRVLRPGGHFVVFATGNRLWPRETHHRRWLVNYLPYALDPVLFSRPVRRGVWPWQIRRDLEGYRDLCGEDGGRRLVAVKAREGASRRKLLALRAANRALRPLGLHHGWIAPHLAMVLEKR
jgi:SAM-dependent methyltransferase